MNGGCAHAFGELLAQGPPLVPVFGGDAHLDEFMRGERAVYFGGHLRCDSAVPNPHHRLQRMRPGLEVGAFT